MGLFDVLRGMSNGPRGQTSATPPGGGGMSPLTMGLLALLAYKALKGTSGLGGIFGGAGPNANSPVADRDGRTASMPPASTGGGLSDWLNGGLGGSLRGSAAGTVLSGGLMELMRRFQQNGHGDTARSWVGLGPNQGISQDDLERAIGSDNLDTLAHESGVPRHQLVRDLSAELPATVDALTPEGRIPTTEEASRWA